MENEKKETSLDRFLAILKEELSLAARLYDEAEAQRKALKDNLNGRDVASATEAVEKTLRELSEAEGRKEALLSDIGVATVSEAVGRMPYSSEKMRAKEYIKMLREISGKIAEIREISAKLLARDTDYLAFSLNVMTAASAAPGYGASEAQSAGTQGRKLFDTSV